MDLSTLFKGASDSLKKLDTSDKSKRTWQTWDSTEDDSWEDVADVTPGPTQSVPQSASQGSTSPTKATDPSAESNTTTTNGTVSSDLDETQSSKDIDNQTKDEPKATSSEEVSLLTNQLRAALDRASTAERKVIALTRARDSRNVDISQHEAQLKAVREEGEKLSVRIAEKETAVRNIRATLKQREASLQDAEASVSALEAKLEAAASRIRQLETNERVANETREVAERRLREVESDAREKTSSSAALDAARAQLESLRKNHASALENQAMRLTADKEAAVTVVEEKAHAREEELQKSISELRTHLTQIVDSAGWREDQLRRENEELRMRAEHLEGRNEELAAALPNATRPLIRQVEALQAAAQERERAKHAVSRSYMDRLRVAEGMTASARERERAAEERVSEILARCAALEEQVKLAQSDAARSATNLARVQANITDQESKALQDLNEALSRAERFERERNAAVADVRDARAAHIDALEAAEDREKALRAQLATAETKVTMMIEREARHHNETDVNVQPGSARASRDQLSEDFDSNSEIINAAQDAAIAEDGDVASIAGVYAAQRLSSSLRLRSGEVTALQAQLDSREKATRALAEEVVALTAKLEDASRERERAPDIIKELGELRRRHETLLVLLGEREERIGELEADLVDLKVMYKEQVTDLLLRIERLSG